MRKPKKDPALEAAAESLKGKKFDLTEFEREACASKLAQLQAAREALLLSVRRQVLERAGAPPELVDVAAVTFHMNGGVPISIEITEPLPAPAKSKPARASKLQKIAKPASK